MKQVKRTINVVDTTSPIIEIVSEVAQNSNNTKPSFVIKSSEAGTIGTSKKDLAKLMML